MLAVGIATQREEVVPVEDDVRSKLFGFGYRCPDLGVVGVLGLQLNGDAGRAGQRSLFRAGVRKGTAAPSDAEEGVLDQAVNHCPERFVVAGSRGERSLVSRQLAMGTGPLLDDGPGVPDLVSDP